MTDIARVWVLPDPPKGWYIDMRKNDGARYICPSRKLMVIASATIQDDGKPWIHVSLSHNERIPTWGELRTVKELFLGDVHAYQVLPPKALYVNLKPNVLHLFSCMDGPQLPEFSGDVPGLGRSL